MKLHVMLPAALCTLTLCAGIGSSKPASEDPTVDLNAITARPLSEIPEMQQKYNEVKKEKKMPHYTFAVLHDQTPVGLCQIQQFVEQHQETDHRADQEPEWITVCSLNKPYKHIAAHATLKALILAHAEHNIQQAHVLAKTDKEKELYQQAGGSIVERSGDSLDCFAIDISRLIARD